ncbi:11S globulin seed storage protein G3-like protein [Tanacetum coccineum]
MTKMIEVYVEIGKTRLNVSEMSPNSISTVINEVDEANKKVALAIVPYFSKQLFKENTVNVPIVEHLSQVTQQSLEVITKSLRKHHKPKGMARKKITRTTTENDDISKDSSQPPFAAKKKTRVKTNKVKGNKQAQGETGAQSQSHVQESGGHSESHVHATVVQQQQFSGQGQCRGKGKHDAQQSVQMGRHQKLENLNKGDVVAIPARAAHWIYNDGQEELVVVVFFDDENKDN